MARFTVYVQRYAEVMPRTYAFEIPFYIVISNAKQKFCLGTRPEDLANIDVIEQKTLKKHYAFLKRLERFPLDKAEYYRRLKETHAVNSVRGLSKVTGEDWSYIARIFLRRKKHRKWHSPFWTKTEYFKRLCCSING